MNAPDNLYALPVEAVRDVLGLSLVHSSEVFLDHHASEKTHLAV